MLKAIDKLKSLIQAFEGLPDDPQLMELTAGSAELTPQEWDNELAKRYTSAVGSLPYVDGDEFKVSVFSAQLFFGEILTIEELLLEAANGEYAKHAPLLHKAHDALMFAKLPLEEALRGVLVHFCYARDNDRLDDPLWKERSEQIISRAFKRVVENSLEVVSKPLEDGEQTT